MCPSSVFGDAKKGNPMDDDRSEWWIAYYAASPKVLDEIEDELPPERP